MTRSYDTPNAAAFDPTNKLHLTNQLHLPHSPAMEASVYKLGVQDVLAGGEQPVAALLAAPGDHRLRPHRDEGAHLQHLRARALIRARQTPRHQLEVTEAGTGT